MAIITDIETARARLIELCAPDVDPALDTSLSAARAATATLAVASQPATSPADTLAVGGKTYTFVAANPTGNQILSSASLNTTAQAILTRVNADTLSTLSTATRNNAALTLTANTPGVAGNAIDLEADGVRIVKVAFGGGAAAVTEDDISRLLARAKQAEIWQAETAYPFGTIIMPTAARRKGLKFELVAFDGAGTVSGATEPAWPSAFQRIERGGLFNWPSGNKPVVRDGFLTWQEAGADIDSLWDLQLAAYYAWDRKIQIASCRYSFKAGEAQEDLNAFIRTLERERDRFASVVFG